MGVVGNAAGQLHASRDGAGAAREWEPAEHKSLKSLDCGHVPQDMRGLIKEVLDWFDRYLGSVRIEAR